MRYQGIAKGGPLDGKPVDLHQPRFLVALPLEPPALDEGPTDCPSEAAVTAMVGAYDFDETAKTWVWTPPAAKPTA